MRLLCWLGIHEWRSKEKLWDGPQPHDVDACARCGTMRWADVIVAGPPNPRPKPKARPLNMGVPIPCPGSVIWLNRAVAETRFPQALADGSAIFRDFPVTRFERELMDAMEWCRLSLCGPYPGSAAAIAAGRRRGASRCTR